MPFDELLPQTRDREHYKFELNSDNEHAVRVLAEIISGALDATPAGLRNGLRVSTLNVGDTITQIPSSPYIAPNGAGRNALSIHNMSDTDKLYVGDSSVTADRVNGVTSGWEIPANGYLNFDITKDVLIYARCESGKTVQIKILEVA